MVQAAFNPMNKTLLLLLLTTLVCVAQTNTPPDMTNADETIRDTLGKYSAVKVFIMPAVTILIMAFRRFVRVVPDQLWPWLAPFVGVALDYAASKTGFWTGSIEAGLAMGATATWFSQLGKQTKEIWQTGPTSTVSGVSEVAESKSTNPS